MFLHLGKVHAVRGRCLRRHDRPLECRGGAETAERDLRKDRAIKRGRSPTPEASGSRSQVETIGENSDIFASTVSPRALLTAILRRDGYRLLLR